MSYNHQYNYRKISTMNGDPKLSERTMLEPTKNTSSTYIPYNLINVFNNKLTNLSLDQGGNNRQFIVGYDGVAVGFEKGPPQANFFWVLTWHLKTRFPYAINSFINFSNKNTISSISGGFTFNILGFFWVLLGVFGLFMGSFGIFWPL